MSLSAVLKGGGHQVKLAYARGAVGQPVEQVAAGFQPDIIAYSAMSVEHVALLEVNRRLKQERSVISVFGGPHATFFPELIQEPGCDAVCVGEGEISFADFCGRVRRGEAYWETPSFIVKHEGRVHRNELLPLVEDLDSLPFPDREGMYALDPVLGVAVPKQFYASRGCPYRCTYCFNRRYNELYRGKGAVVRHRSPEDLIREILAVKARYPLPLVWINDDTFLIKPRGWLERFARLYGEQVALPILCNVRADLVTGPEISMLRAVGLEAVFMGVECGDDRVAHEMLGRDQTCAQILHAAAILRGNGVHIISQNLVGLPMAGSYNNDLKTLDLNIEIAPHFALAALTYPFPGTAIHDMAAASGRLCLADTPPLETNKRASMFTYASPEEKRRVENLQKLFGIIVDFPTLRPLTDMLCGLPLERLYTVLFYLWYGYCFKTRFVSGNDLTAGLSSYLRLFLRMVRKT